VARRCDDTVDKKRVNSCVWKLLFLEGDEQPKISPKKPGNALSDALLMSRFQNFAADAARKETALRWNRGYQLFNSNEFGAKDSEKLFPSLVTGPSRVAEALADTAQIRCGRGLNPAKCWLPALSLQAPESGVSVCLTPGRMICGGCPRVSANTLRFDTWQAYQRIRAYWG